MTIVRFHELAPRLAHLQLAEPVNRHGLGLSLETGAVPAPDMRITGERGRFPDTSQGPQLAPPMIYGGSAMAFQPSVACSRIRVKGYFCHFGRAFARRRDLPNRARDVSVGSRPDDYRLGALRDDLSKLRAKGLVEIAKRRLIAPPALTPIPVSRNLTFEIAACAPVRMRLRERRVSC